MAKTTAMPTIEPDPRRRIIVAPAKDALVSADRPEFAAIDWAIAASSEKHKLAIISMFAYRPPAGAALTAGPVVDVPPGGAPAAAALGGGSGVAADMSSTAPM